MVPPPTMISPLPEATASFTLVDHDSGDDEETQSSFSGGILFVRVHDAQGIHNICIYDKQDVFAKLTFTHGKAEPVCTQVVSKGGKNPVFNESFQLPVTIPNSVLKCEMWMSSRAHSYLEDQLLGFVLVPLSSLERGHDRTNNVPVPEEYKLSSTELFHSPAGIVRLTLVFRERRILDSSGVVDAAAGHSSKIKESGGSSNDDLHQGIDKMKMKKKKKHTFIKVFEDGHGSSSGSESPPYHYWDVDDDRGLERIEFPDLQAASEDQQLVSSYLEMPSSNHLIVTGPSFLLSSLSKDHHDSGGGGTSKLRSDSSDRKSSSSRSSSSEVVTVCSSDDHCETSASSQQIDPSPPPKGSSSSLQDHSPAMQQQIVDLYMKSMQQFTEALAKMQLPPLDLNDHTATLNAAKKSKSHKETGGDKNKSTHRVFYGSRAFF